MKNYLWPSGLIVFLLVVMISCAGQPAPSPTPLAGVSTPIPTSLPSSGTVTGFLFDDVERGPLVGYVLYLAKLLEPMGEQLSVAALDTQADPRAITDSAGQFTFTNVAPATYALALLTPTGAVLILDPVTKKEIVFSVAAGDVVNLGEIRIHPNF